MRSIKGRILVFETGAPISNIIVAAFDTNRSLEPNVSNLHAMDRLGSAITDAHGAFNIDFRDEEFQDESDVENRPDIILALYPPEVAGLEASNFNEPFYITPQPRTDVSSPHRIEPGGVRVFR